MNALRRLLARLRERRTGTGRTSPPMSPAQRWLLGEDYRDDQPDDNDQPEGDQGDGVDDEGNDLPGLSR